MYAGKNRVSKKYEAKPNRIEGRNINIHNCSWEFQNFVLSNR